MNKKNKFYIGVGIGIIIIILIIIIDLIKDIKSSTSEKQNNYTIENQHETGNVQYNPEQLNNLKIKIENIPQEVIERIDDEKKKISLNDEVSSSFFYGSWAVLSFPIFIGSVQSNIFYLIQTLVVCAFFVVRCIGEYYGNDNMNEIISGVLELVTGFISLYICINQMINESFKFNAVPSLPLSKENEIDIIPDN